MSRQVDGDPPAFWAQASHDLRQPVQSLQLLIRVLQARCADPETRTVVDHMEAALASLQQMFEALTELARLEAGLKIPQHQNCDIGVLCRSILRDVQDVATEFGLRLSSSAIEVSGQSDPAILALIVRSLILNAVIFADHSEIRVSCEDHGTDLQLAVSFGGPQITARQRECVFAELRRTTAEKPLGELALGPAALQRFARILGHKLDLASSGEGTQSFTLILPRSRHQPG